MRFNLLTCTVLLSLLVLPAAVFGQAVEINPYGGYIWTGHFGGDIGDFKNGQLLGVRGGGYVTHDFEIGGNYSWNNHFQPTSSNPNAAFAGNLGFPQGAVRANIWEVEFTYNFATRNVTGATVRP